MLLGLNQGTSLSTTLRQEVSKWSLPTNIADYCTIVGWSSYAAKFIYVFQRGNILHLTTNIAGTSNSTATTITLPTYLYKLANIVQTAHVGYGVNNGTVITNCVLSVTTPATNLITFTNGGTSLAWTASGTKSIIVQLHLLIQ